MVAQSVSVKLGFGRISKLLYDVKVELINYFLCAD